jgi:hypothetical protein
MTADMFGIGLQRKDKRYYRSWWKNKKRQKVKRIQSTKAKQYEIKKAQKWKCRNAKYNANDTEVKSTEAKSTMYDKSWIKKNQILKSAEIKSQDQKQLAGKDPILRKRVVQSKDILDQRIRTKEKPIESNTWQLKKEDAGRKICGKSVKSKICEIVIAE